MNIRALVTATLALLAVAPAAHAARTAAPDARGQVHAFLTGPDGAAYETGADGWTSIGGPAGGSLLGPIAVARDADGRLEAFARGADGAIWRAAEATPEGTWTAWASLGGVFAGPPDVVSDKDGRLEVFARDTGNTIQHAV